MFGHVLRMPQGSPAQAAMDYYYAHKRRPGRPVKCLATSVREDMEKAGASLRTLGDLKKMRKKTAKDENGKPGEEWRAIAQSPGVE